MSKHDFRMYENLTLVTQIGIMSAVPIVGGLWLGDFLDKKLHTSPIFLLLLVMFGMVSSLYNLYKFAVRRSDRGRKR